MRLAEPNRRHVKPDRNPLLRSGFSKSHRLRQCLLGFKEQRNAIQGKRLIWLQHTSNSYSRVVTFGTVGSGLALKVEFQHIRCAQSGHSQKGNMNVRLLSISIVLLFLFGVSPLRAEAADPQNVDKIAAGEKSDAGEPP